MITRIRRRVQRLIELSATENKAHPSSLPQIDDIRAQLETMRAENDSLFGMLYQMAHNNEQAADFATMSTVGAFGHQWANMQEGAFMLSDPWFRENVTDIITRQELQIDASWFKGKKAVDAGCGGGRWSYGLTKLGCDVTAVDINESAISATRKAIESAGGSGNFVLTPLEQVGEKLPPETFDLAWSWGVLHHCNSFNRALRAVAGLVKPGGVLHLYLYGRETIPLADDVEIFKRRMRYNFLPTDAARLAFLKEMAASHGLDLHHVHDIYAPLINRRYRFGEVAEMLRPMGFSHFEQTIVHKEVWLRAIKGEPSPQLAAKLLPKVSAPYWFERTPG